MSVASILLALLMPVARTALERGRQARCLSNLRQIGIAMNMHFLDKRRYPLGSGTNNYQAALVPYMNFRPTVVDPGTYRFDPKFLCPSIVNKYFVGQPGLWGYGYNETVVVDVAGGGVPPEWPEIDYGGYNCVLEGANIPYPSKKIAMVCNTGGNFWAYPPWDITASGGSNPWLIYPYGIHGGGDNYLFCDGHLEFIKNSDDARINRGFFLNTKLSPYQE